MQCGTPAAASTGAIHCWRHASRWSAHAGLRTTRVDFESADHYVVGANPDDSGAVDYSATTPVAGLVFRLDPQTSLYANYGRGFETPTFVELAYRNAGTGLNLDLVPSRSRHVEAGVKAVRPGLARINAAVFARAYGNDGLVRLFAQAQDPDGCCARAGSC